MVQLVRLRPPQGRRDVRRDATYERHGDPALSKHVRQVRAARRAPAAAPSARPISPHANTIPRAGTSDPARGSTTCHTRLMAMAIRPQ